MTDRSVYRWSSRRTKKTHNLELGGGLESGDGDYVIGIEEREKQVSVNGGRTQLRSTARSSKLVVKNRKNSNAGPSRSTPYIFSRGKFVVINFQILEAPAMSTAPRVFFLFFH